MSPAKTQRQTREEDMGKLNEPYLELDPNTMLSNKRDNYMLAVESPLPKFSCPHCRWPIVPGLNTTHRAATGTVKCQSCHRDVVNETLTAEQRREMRDSIMPPMSPNEKAARLNLEGQHRATAERVTSMQKGPTTLALDGGHGQLLFAGRLWRYTCPSEVCGHRVHEITETANKKFGMRLCSCGRQFSERAAIRSSEQVISAKDLIGRFSYEKVRVQTWD